MTVSSTRLRETFEAMPLSAFKGSDEASPVNLLRRIFGESTTASEVIYCSQLGSWVSGWAVIVPLHEGGVAGFRLRRVDDVDWRWEGVNRWNRMQVIDQSLKGPISVGRDMLDLVISLADEIGKTSGPDCYYDFDQNGVINNETAPWLLRHAMSVLSAQDLEAAPFLLSLSQGGAEHQHTRRLLHTANDIYRNFHDGGSTKATEAVIAQVFRQDHGVTVSGAQVESTGLGGALMGYPREDWLSEARRMVKYLYETGSLSSTYYPKKSSTSDPTPPEPTGPRRLSNFAIAA